MGHTQDVKENYWLHSCPSMVLFVSIRGSPFGAWPRDTVRRAIDDKSRNGWDLWDLCDLYD
jgi:hypothetical protein